jgi:hypothetical protein
MDYAPGMKLLLSIAAYVGMGLVLAWGILLTIKGNPWLLVAGVVAYLLALWRLGCTSGSPETH